MTEKNISDTVSPSPGETERLAYEFASCLRPGDFVALFGDLGAGKTAFVRGAVGYLAPGRAVRSPTYSIMNEYKSAACTVYHFDMYRIDSPDSLYSTGFFDVTGGTGICFSEWSENIKEELPSVRYEVYISRCPESDSSDKRHVKIIRLTESN